MTNHYFKIMMLVGISVVLTACSAPEKPSKLTSATRDEKPFSLGPNESRTDVERLRDTVWIEKKGRNASSEAALQAAQRIFSTEPIVGMKRGRILEMLGDPQTISDYGVPAAGHSNAPLFYRFDTGSGGVEYVIFFSHGRATKVVSRYLDETQPGEEHDHDHDHDHDHRRPLLP